MWTYVSQEIYDLWNPRLELFGEALILFNHVNVTSRIAITQSQNRDGANAQRLMRSSAFHWFDHEHRVADSTQIPDWCPLHL